MADAIKGSTVLAEEMVLLMDLEVEKEIYIYIYVRWPFLGQPFHPWASFLHTPQDLIPSFAKPKA